MEYLKTRLKELGLSEAGGVARTFIIDGRILHAVLLEIFTDSGVGTLLVP